MHKLLSDNKVAHTYIEVRGVDDKASGHDYAFTSMALPIVVSFIDNWFKYGQGRLVCTLKDVEVNK